MGVCDRGPHNSVQATFGVMESFGNEEVPAEDITECLPCLGERGWELVTCHPLKALGIDGQHLILSARKHRQKNELQRHTGFSLARLTLSATLCYFRPSPVTFQTGDFDTHL